MLNADVLQELQIEKTKLEIEQMSAKGTDEYLLINKIDCLRDLIDTKVINTDAQFTENNLENAFSDMEIRSMKAKIMNLIKLL